MWESIGRIESAIPYALIMAYLKDELHLEEQGDGLFYFEDCQIKVRQLAPRRLGGVELPCTGLSFAGGEAAQEEFKRKFMLRFLSAGG